MTNSPKSGGKRKQLIDFDDCERCGVGQLYQVNDADDGFFYDGDPVMCDNCGFEVGRTICDEDDCRVSFHDEIDVHHYDTAMTKYDQVTAKLERATKALKSCKAAMDYAYEDRVDQYYLNMKEDIEKALAEIGQEEKP